MKKRNVFILVIAISVCIIALSVIPSSASDQVLLDNTFEDGSTSSWIDDTGRGNKTIETEDSGNKYLALTSTSSYFNYQALDSSVSGLIYFEFDVKFTTNNMEVQIRKKVNNGAAGYTMAGRIRKNAYYIEYFSDGKTVKLLDTNGGWLQVKDVSKWYHVKMTLDTNASMQSIYLSERDTGAMLGKTENVPFMGECDSVNYFAVSSSDKVCMDNVKITKSDVKALKITGEPYPKKSVTGTVTYQYTCKNINNAGNVTNDADDVVWSLAKPAAGVSINADTGVLSVQDTAKPVPVMIQAVKKNAPSIRGTYLVDIEK